MSVVVNVYLVAGAIFISGAAYVLGCLSCWFYVRGELAEAERKSRLVVEACETEERGLREAVRTEQRMTEHYKTLYHDAELANVLIEQSKGERT